VIPEPDARAAAERVERLLEQLRAGPDPRTAVVAEELVRCLVQLYGAGLERIVAMVGPERGQDLCGDALVESLLLVHDLHPLDADTRIRQALDRARPGLGSHTGDLDYLGIDGAGVAHVRLTGGGQGCRSSAGTARQAIETAIQDAAPEVTGVEVEVATPAPPLLRITRRPGLGEPSPRPGLGEPSPSVPSRLVPSRCVPG
jgi:Fe-S cluster biogenesis protein NfuA